MEWSRVCNAMRSCRVYGREEILIRQTVLDDVCPNSLNGAGEERARRQLEEKSSQDEKLEIPAQKNEVVT